MPRPRELPQVDRFYVALGRSVDVHRTYVCNTGHAPSYLRYGGGLVSPLDGEHDVVIQPGEKYRLVNYRGFVSVWWKALL